MAPGAPLAATIQTDDLESMETAIEGIPLRTRRMAPGGGSIELALVATSGMSITCGRFGFPVRSVGAIDDRSEVFALQLEPGPGWWNNRQFAADRLWCYGPGSEHEGSSTRPPSFAVITVPARELSGPSGEHRVVRTTGVDHLRAHTLDALDLARTGSISEDRADALERDVRSVLADILMAGADEPRAESGAARQLVDESIALTEVLGPMPSTSELAEALGVSDRWVRTAFKAVHGVSVSSFFRSWALHEAHCELRTARPESRSVTDVAMRWGFWHLGRFAGLYRSYFGELPKVTLARRPG